MRFRRLLPLLLFIAIVVLSACSAQITANQEREALSVAQAAWDIESAAIQARVDARIAAEAARKP